MVAPAGLEENERCGHQEKNRKEYGLIPVGGVAEELQEDLQRLSYPVLVEDHSTWIQ